MDAEAVDCSSRTIQVLEIGIEYQHKTVDIDPLIRKDTGIRFPKEKKQQC
jgi:hypothetical protein